MWIRRQPSTATPNLAPEMIKVLGFKATLKVSAGVDTWCGVALKIHVVTRLAVVFAAEEMIEADFVQRRR
jgi:hypothetical protein